MTMMLPDITIPLGTDEEKNPEKLNGLFKVKVSKWQIQNSKPGLLPPKFFPLKI